MARNDFQILQKRDEIQYKLSSNMGHQHKLHPSADVFFNRFSKERVSKIDNLLVWVEFSP